MRILVLWVQESILAEKEKKRKKKGKNIGSANCYHQEVLSHLWARISSSVI